MNKQELIKNLNFARDSLDNEDDFRSGVRTGLALAIFEIEQLDEPAKPSKPVIPRFVADWIDAHDLHGNNPLREYRDLEIDFNEGWTNEKDATVYHWVNENPYAFIDALRYGYEAEKEQLYYVLDKQGKTLLVLMSGEVRVSGGYVLSESTANKEIYQLTEKQIKDYDERFWPFVVEVAE